MPRVGSTKAATSKPGEIVPVGKKVPALAVPTLPWTEKALLQLPRQEKEVRKWLKENMKEDVNAVGTKISDFQVSVWAICCLVPRGQVCTYGAMALVLCAKKHLEEELKHYEEPNDQAHIDGHDGRAVLLGLPSSKFSIVTKAVQKTKEKVKVKGYGALARGVGQALRRNPIAPQVPCHRVVSSSGALHGFCGSMGDAELGKKAQLLLAEGVTLAPGGQAVNKSCLLSPNSG